MNTKQRIGIKLLAILLWIAAQCFPAMASPADVLLVGVSPFPTSGTLGISGVAPSGDIGFAQFIAQPFSLTQSATTSGIILFLSGSGSYPLLLQLTNAVGPGATAANVLMQFSFSFPYPSFAANQYLPETIAIPSNVSLSAGNYFLVLSSTQPQVGTSPPLVLGWDDFGFPIKGQVGHTLLATDNPFFASSSVDPSFPPDSSFVSVFESPMGFEIFGTPTPTPEPDSLLLMLSGFGILIEIARRRG